MLKQAMNTVRRVSEEKDVQSKVFHKVAEKIPRVTLHDNPAIISQIAYEAVSEVCGVEDPYASVKRQTNAAALRILPRVKASVLRRTDRLAAALHAAVAGNIIDLGIGHVFDIENDILRLMDEEFTIDATEEFRKELVPGRRLLYLGDNAGEIVFDTILLEELLERGLNITFSVKSGPIINDALMEDAEQTGVSRLVRVVETGSNDIGINWNRISREFRDAYEQADIVLSKGQGNFETCNEQKRNMYFLLKAKCPIVARILGVHDGDFVFKRQVL